MVAHDLFDESVRWPEQFSSDELQAMLNQMCYMYFNWPGPIRCASSLSRLADFAAGCALLSVPAACMYAHKLAYLFGKHINGQPNPALTPYLFYL